MTSNGRWSWWPEVTSKKDELTLAFLALTVIAMACRRWSRYKSSTSPLPPGPRGLPVVGYLPFLSSDLHHQFTVMAHRYGPIFKLKLGSKTHIVVSSSELAKAVVREHDECFSNRNPPVAGLVLDYGGQNIVWSDSNSYWRNMRKVLAYEVLSKKNLETSSIFRRIEARKTVKHVYDAIGTEIDVGGIAFLTSLRVVTSVLWGGSFVEDGRTSIELREVICRIVDLLGAPNVSDFFPVVARFDLQGVGRAMKRQWRKVDGIFDAIIEERMKLNAMKIEEEVEKEGRKDFLQILLELKDKDQNAATSFNVTQIKALLMDIMIGGTDTTSTMVEWTMAELLHNPNVMKKVQDELEEIVGPNSIVEECHIPKLTYLDAAVKETFRLHPALPLLIGRSPNKTCKVGGYTIPKGSTVLLNIWAIHRDPKHWDTPLDFNPIRFLNYEGQTEFDYNGYNCNFLPFGSGRRRCPGVSLGEKMLMYFLASLLHSFEWTLPNSKGHELSEKFGIVLKKRKPLIAIPSPRLQDKNLYV